eukprot:3047972-Amphidinium_carterae.1
MDCATACCWATGAIWLVWAVCCGRAVWAGCCDVSTSRTCQPMQGASFAASHRNAHTRRAHIITTTAANHLTVFQSFQGLCSCGWSILAQPLMPQNVRASHPLLVKQHPPELGKHSRRCNFPGGKTLNSGLNHETTMNSPHDPYWLL